MARNTNNVAMVIRILSMFLGTTFLCLPEPADGASVSVHLTGVGRMSCAHWRSTQASRSEGNVWIYGFWSGLNYVAAASEQTQSNVDDTAMVTEVEKICAQRPSEVLASAAWTAYLNFSKR